MTDYTQVIDAETWAFIRETERWYGPDAHSQAIEESRRRYAAMSRAFFAGYPHGVDAQDSAASGVGVRAYRSSGRNAEATVLFAHGGSLTLGGLDSHDDVCAEICAGTGFDVIAVDYRLLPEFSVEDSIDDVQAALDWLRQDRGGPVILVGDSAGGFLCTRIARDNRDAGDVIGQVLIYPGVGFDLAGGSLEKHANAPLLSKKEVVAAQMATAGTGSPGRNGQDLGDMTGLPMTVAISAECDPIADQARIYAERILAAGGKALWIEDKGLVHGHLRARHTVARARASFERVLRAISLIGAGQVPTRQAVEKPRDTA